MGPSEVEPLPPRGIVYKRTAREEAEFQRAALFDRRIKLATRWIMFGSPVVLVLLIVAYCYWPDPAFVCTPGSVVRQEPVQTPIAGAAQPWSFKGDEFTPLANYDLEGLVLSKHAYSGDPVSNISKWDLSVTWGAMTDPAIVATTQVKQYERHTVAWFQDVPYPIPWKVLLAQFSNVHTIPANDEVAAALDALPTGQIGRLTGKLVRVDVPNCEPWISSLTRYDTGDGACEIMWVEHVTWMTQEAYMAAHPQVPQKQP